MIVSHTARGAFRTKSQPNPTTRDGRSWLKAELRRAYARLGGSGIFRWISTTGLAEIGLVNLGASSQLGGRAFGDDPSLGQHVAVVGDRERLADVLLDQEHGHAAL